MPSFSGVPSVQALKLVAMLGNEVDPEQLPQIAVEQSPGVRCLAALQCRLLRLLMQFSLQLLVATIFAAHVQPQSSSRTIVRITIQWRLFSAMVGCLGRAATCFWFFGFSLESFGLFHQNCDFESHFGCKMYRQHRKRFDVY